jgi:hypothetical protein
VADFLRTFAMTIRPFSYTQLGLALAAGLALRLYFIVHFPFYAGDTKFYEELARNWMDHGVYGLLVMGQLVPVDMRTPGYPSFLAAIYFLLPRGDVDAGVFGFGDVRFDSVDCGAAGGCGAAPGGGDCGFVDDGALSFYG